MELLLKDEVYRVVGAAMEVHSVLGSSFLEAVYQEALQWELQDRGIAHEAQKELDIHFKARVLAKRYVADLVCFGTLLVELKAIDALTPRDRSQVINYLAASRLRVGLLINFGARGQLEWERLVL